MADPLFKVGVLGATGFIGAPYRAEIRECNEAGIVAVCARRKDLLARAAEEDGAQLATSDWQEVVEHPGVNFVIVGTPDALHHEAVLACAEQGKHLLCEKPVGMNAAEAGEMWGLSCPSGRGWCGSLRSHGRWLPRTNWERSSRPSSVGRIRVLPICR